MPRPPRTDYPGAMQHLYVRGVARTSIAADERDFERHLHLLALAASRFDLELQAWCYLMNHAHILVISRLGNISRAMHWLGTCTAQSFNRRHDRSGHLYQGRFGSRLVNDDAYLRELARYIPLNPVRAGLVEKPQDWPWSSFAATIGLEPRPAHLSAEPFLGLFESATAYAAWVGAKEESTLLDDDGLPRPPARPPLAEILVDNSDTAIAVAHFRHGYTQRAISDFLGLSRPQVTRRLNRAAQNPES